MSTLPPNASVDEVWTQLVSKPVPRDVAFDRRRIWDTIRYLPSHIIFSAAFCLTIVLIGIIGINWQSFAFWLLLAFAAIFISNPILFVLAVRQNWYLSRYGIVVKGKVTWKLWLRYGAMTRAEYEINGKVYQEHTANDYFSIDAREKDEVLLLVDPKDPHVSTIYGRGFFVVR